MPSVGQIEKKTQERVLALLSQRLGYTYLGDWIDRPANSNIEPERLKAWLASQGVSDALAARALFELQKAAFDTSKSLYDRNHAVYRLLRYGVKVRPEAGENTITVWLVKWADPLANDFAVAEEVTVPGGDLVSGAKASTKRPDVVLYVNGIALGVLELKAKKRFIEQPGQLKLLIVVDKLLTGFDSPPATYLYIDKKMQDHGLFQAICRVNRLDGEDKPYGYIIDYKDLFKPLEGAVRDYTSGAFDAFDEDDVKGLLKDRLAEARQDLEEGLELLPIPAVQHGCALCLARPRAHEEIERSDPTEFAR